MEKEISGGDICGEEKLGGSDRKVRGGDRKVRGGGRKVRGALVGDGPSR